MFNEILDYDILSLINNNDDTLSLKNNDNDRDKIENLYDSKNEINLNFKENINGQILSNSNQPDIILSSSSYDVITIDDSPTINNISNNNDNNKVNMYPSLDYIRQYKPYKPFIIKYNEKEIENGELESLSIESSISNISNEIFKSDSKPLIEPILSASNILFNVEFQNELELKISKLNKSSLKPNSILKSDITYYDTFCIDKYGYREILYTGYKASHNNLIISPFVSRSKDEPNISKPVDYGKSNSQYPSYIPEIKRLSEKGQLHKEALLKLLGMDINSKPVTFEIPYHDPIVYNYFTKACFNCGKSHQTRECPMEKDVDMIRFNSKLFKDLQAPRKNKVANARYFDQSEIAKPFSENTERLSHYTKVQDFSAEYTRVNHKPKEIDAFYSKPVESKFERPEKSRFSDALDHSISRIESDRKFFDNRSSDNRDYRERDRDRDNRRPRYDSYQHPLPPLPSPVQYSHSYPPPPPVYMQPNNEYLPPHSSQDLRYDPNAIQYQHYQNRRYENDYRDDRYRDTYRH